jgi:hypothetical protein
MTGGDGATETVLLAAAAELLATGADTVAARQDVTVVRALSLLAHQTHAGTSVLGMAGAVARTAGAGVRGTVFATGALQCQATGELAAGLCRQASRALTRLMRTESTVARTPRASQSHTAVVAASHTHHSTRGRTPRPRR